MIIIRDIQFTRITRENLDARASEDGLKPGEPFVVVDAQVFAVAITKSTYIDVGPVATTDQIGEGEENLYFTPARAVSAIKGDDAWKAGNWDVAYNERGSQIAGAGLSWSSGNLNVDDPFNPSGTYTNLRAQATTKGDVGLSLVDNVQQVNKAGDTMTGNLDFSGGIHRVGSSSGHNFQLHAHGGVRVQLFSGEIRCYRSLHPDSSGNNRDFGFTDRRWRHGWFSGTVTANDVEATSDRKLKKDIKPLLSDWCLDVVQNLRPVTFKWKKNNEESHGLIAQEVQSIAPMMSNGKSVNFQKLVTYLIGAVQSQQKQIDELRENLDDLT